MLGSKVGSISILVVSAKLIRDTEVFGTMDPYCKIKIGDRKVKTFTCEDAGLRPVWNQQFDFDLYPEDEEIIFKVNDQDGSSGDDRIGEGKLPIASLKLGRLNYKVKIFYDGKEAGTVYLEIYLTKENEQIVVSAEPTKYTPYVPPEKVTRELAIQNTEKIFEIYDKNKNGTLDYAEFKSAINELFVIQGYPTPNEGQLEWTLKSIDLNSDKTVTFQEFKKFVQVLFRVPNTKS